jgi:microcystin-dependent protein
MFGGPTAPTDWLICDGASLLRAGAYAGLFAVIGVAFGAADGTHFNLPDFRERGPLGKGATHALAATGGSTTQAIAHSLTLPSHAHNHALTLPSHTHSQSLTLPNHAHAHSLTLPVHVHGVSQLGAAISMGTGIFMNRAATAANWSGTHLSGAVVASVSAVSRANAAPLVGLNANTNNYTDGNITSPAVDGTVGNPTTNPGIGGTVDAPLTGAGGAIGGTVTTPTTTPAIGGSITSLAGPLDPFLTVNFIIKI